MVVGNENYDWEQLEKVSPITCVLLSGFKIAYLDHVHVLVTVAKLCE